MLILKKLGTHPIAVTTAMSASKYVVIGIMNLIFATRSAPLCTQASQMPATVGYPTASY